MLTLLEETTTLACDLLEKNGSLLPFCMARTKDEKTLIISSDDFEDGTIDPQSAATSLWFDLTRRVEAGEIAKFAFCSDSEIKLANEADYRRFLKVDFQNGLPESAVYLFPLAMENGVVRLASKYLQADSPRKLL